jgi:hypothetical protein
MAIALMHHWKTKQVKPVVMVTYESVYVFRPSDDRSPAAPRWTTYQVTAIASTEGLDHFVHRAIRELLCDRSISGRSGGKPRYEMVTSLSLHPARKDPLK